LLKNCTNGRWADEHAKSWVALEITFSLNLTVILASGVVQFNTNPLSIREVGETDETNSSLPSVGQRNHRAGGDLLTSHREIQGQSPTTSTFKIGRCWLSMGGGQTGKEALRRSAATRAADR
jgi:hypothetical protein